MAGAGAGIATTYLNTQCPQLLVVPGQIEGIPIATTLTPLASINILGRTRGMYSLLVYILRPLVVFLLSLMRGFHRKALAIGFGWA